MIVSRVKKKKKKSKKDVLNRAIFGEHVETFCKFFAFRQFTELTQNQSLQRFEISRKIQSLNEDHFGELEQI